MKTKLSSFEIKSKFFWKLFSFYALEFKCFILSLIFIIVKGILNTRGKGTIWIVGENFGENLKDNGYCFFKYCQKTGSRTRLFFIAKKRSIKEDIFLSSERNVLVYGSIRHIAYLFMADVYIYSHSPRDIIFRNLLPLFTKNKKLIFLQHGVTGFKRINDFYSKRHLPSPDIITVVSDLEKSIFKEQFGAEEKRIKVTGFARYDNLKNNGEPQARRQIAYLPTWRDWQKKSNFFESRFYKISSAFISNNSLAQLLEKNGINFIFYLHKNMKEYLPFYESKKKEINLIEFGQESVQNIIIESSLLITDYSSVSWDFLYLDKPVIFFQVDLADYLKYRGAYLDFKKDIFGDATDSHRELVDLIDFYINNNFKVKEKYSNFKKRYFKYNDQQNCKRIFMEIERL